MVFEQRWDVPDEPTKEREKSLTYHIIETTYFARD
jgi:hypothetical protein